MRSSLASGMMALVSVFTAGSALAGVAQRQAPVEPTKNIVEVAASEPSLSTLVTAVKAADLVGTLSTTPNLTVFAPTNDAFAKLPAGTLDGLLKDKAALANVLTYHVIDKLVTFKDASSLTAATMLNGMNASLRAEGDSLFINNAKIISKDIRATNGIVHVIDAVLIPMQ